MTDIANLPNVQDVGFEAFTAKLVVDVFDALVASNIRQTQNYIELVNSLSKSLKDYVNDTHDATDLSEVLAFLAKVVPPKPDAEAPARLVPGAKVELSEGEKAALANALTLKADSGGISSEKVVDNVPALAEPHVVGGNLTDEGWNKILEAAARRIAADKYSILQEMVKQGMMRLVVSDGEILTRLKFHTETSDYWKRVSRTYDKSTKEWGIRGRTGFGLMRWIGLSGGTQNNTLSVRTSRTTEGENENTTIDIYGSVRIRFKTDYLPLAK